MSRPKLLAQGWAQPSSKPSRIPKTARWHYFVSQQSLCGRWRCPLLETFEHTRPDSRDNCTTCARKIKLIASQRKETTPNA